jgi:hypothetical protein
MRMRSIFGSSSLFLLLAIGCGDDKGTGDSGTDTGTAGTAGTADTGESGSMSMTSGDGDGDTVPGDGDGDTAEAETSDGCVVGTEGCPCTPGGGCDPGLICDAGVCAPAPGDGDGDGDNGDGDGDGDGDTGPGDGDGDGDTGPGDGDGDGDPGVPYQACPGGEDSECAQGEICAQGDNNGMQWSLCTTPCQGPDDCAVDDNDGCANLPGDGSMAGFCDPLLFCNFGNPCPMGMQCMQGNGGSLCLWPN